jgi:hypothetical protein
MTLVEDTDYIAVVLCIFRISSLVFLLDMIRL